MSRFWRHFISNGGRTRRQSYLGLKGRSAPIPFPLPRRSQPAQTSGVAVRCVAPDGPAAGAGLCEGDVLVSLGDRPVAGAPGLRDLLIVLPAEVPMPVVLVRGGRLVERFIVLSDHPDPART